MRREDDQELWDLLGKGAAPSLSPFFARNVVRQVRQETASRPALFSWLRPRILAPAAAVVLALAVGGVVVDRMQRGQSSDDLPAALTTLDPQDFEVVADLDLVSFEDDNVWEDEDDTAAL